MKIESLKSLKALIKLCQTEGVRAIEIDGIKLDLNSPPVKQKRYKEVSSDLELPLEAQLSVPQMEQIDSDELTQEQMLFYSSVGQAQQ